MSEIDSTRWRRWTGLAYDAEMITWLDRAPQIVHWIEVPLTDDYADLLVTYRQAKEHPIRVPAGWWLHFDGRHVVAFEKGPDHG